MSYVFGKAIYDLRKERRMTLEELATRIDSSKGYISGIETCMRRPPSDDVVIRLAKVLKANRAKLLRLAHVDKIPEDIKQELRSSTIITPPKIVKEMGQDLATLLWESNTAKRKKMDTPYALGQVPLINKKGQALPSEFSKAEDLWQNSEFFQVNIPGLSCSFAIHAPDVSMERRKGVSFPEGNMVFFTPVKRIQPGDCLFVIYQSEKGLSCTFRALKESKRRGLIHLVTLNTGYKYRRETILPRKNVEGIWKAVSQMQFI